MPRWMARSSNPKEESSVSHLAHDVSGCCVGRGGLCGQTLRRVEHEHEVVRVAYGKFDVGRTDPHQIVVGDKRWINAFHVAGQPLVALGADCRHNLIF